MTRRPWQATARLRPHAGLLLVCLLAAACGGPGQPAGTPDPSVAEPSPAATGDGVGGDATPDPEATAGEGTEDGGLVVTPDDTATGDGRGGTEGDGAADPPPFYANTAPEVGNATGGAGGLLTDIRMGAHEGFDRVVLEFAGAGTPGWDVRYVDAPVGSPGGEPVRIEGAAVLAVGIDPVAYPQDDPTAYDGPGRLRIPDAQVVSELVYASLFEGRLQAFVGVDDGEMPFRVYRLTEPSRVVIEVSTR